MAKATLVALKSKENVSVYKQKARITVIGSSVF